MLLALRAVLDRSAADHPPLARVGVALVEDDVARRVGVGEDGARVIGRVGDRPGAVLALAERVDGAGGQVGAEAVVQRLVARLRDKVGDAGSGVDVNEVRPFAAERLGVERLREAAFERDHEGLVNLVAVVVDHHDDTTVVGEDEEWVAADQLRILEGDPGGSSGSGTPPAASIA